MVPRSDPREAEPYRLQCDPPPGKRRARKAPSRVRLPSRSEVTIKPRPYSDGLAAIPSEMLEDPRLGKHAIVVALALVSRLPNKFDEALLTNLEIGHRSPLKPHEIREGLDELEAAEWIQRVVDESQVSGRAIILLWRLKSEIPRLDGEPVEAEAPHVPRRMGRDAPRRKGDRRSAQVPVRPGATRDAPARMGSRVRASNLPEEKIQEKEKESSPGVPRDQLATPEPVEPEAVDPRELERHYAAYNRGGSGRGVSLAWLVGNGWLCLLPTPALARERATPGRPSVRDDMPRPAAPPSRPATIPADFRLTVKRLVAALEPVEQRDAAADRLYAYVATHFAVKGDLSPELWPQRFRWFGGSENGRVRLTEMILTASAKRIEGRENYLATCLGNEASAWRAQKPTPGATLECPPGAGRIRSSIPVGKCTREVIP